MPTGFPNVRDGDQLQPWMLNVIYRELERWRKMDAAPPLGVDFADDGYASPYIHSGAQTDDLIPVLTGAGGIAAGSYSAPSSATVTLLEDNAGGPGFATTSSTDTMYNPSTTSISGSKFCWAERRSNGYLYLVVGDC